MILFMALLSMSSLLAEGTLEPNHKEETVASKAQIRFAIENRYDDTGPGSKGPELAHKMYTRLDDALVAYMNDPDTKLPDAEKIRAFRRLVGTDYGLQHPNQLSPSLERGPYKLMSVDPQKYNYEQPPYLQDTRPSNNVRVQEPNDKWEPPYLKDTKSLLRFQELQNQNGHRGGLKAASEYNKLNKDPFYDALNKDNPLKYTLSHDTFLQHPPSWETLQKPQVSKHNVFQQPSSNRIVYKPENLNFKTKIIRVPSQNALSFFDLQRTVMKAERQNLLPQSPQDFESRRPREYSYSYGVNDPKSGDWKAARETRHRDGGVSGYYALVEPDGKTRFVKYTADRDGFVASVDRSKAHFLQK